jgi:hypothetical protein
MDTAELNAGFWFRFDRYEMWRGYIRPVRNARLQRYDPWGERSAFGGRADNKPRWSPRYQSLLDLADQQTRDPAAYLENVKNWCQTNGPLGLLLQRTLRVTLAPRFERRARRRSPQVPEEWAAYFRAIPPRRGLVPMVVQHHRTTRGWRTVHTPIAQLQGSPQRHRHGQLVPNGSSAPDVPRPGALIQPIEWIEEWADESLATTWARFFPNVPEVRAETHQYPQPLSDEFCRQYAEPVADFSAAVRSFRAWIEEIGDANAKQLQHWFADVPVRELHGVLASVSPVVVPKPRAMPALLWIGPSLFASIVMMAVQDLTAAKRLIRCRNDTCGKLTIVPPTAGRAQDYCSVRCRNTAQVRRKQEKRTKAKRLILMGYTAEKVAAKTHVAARVAQDWVDRWQRK